MADPILINPQYPGFNVLLMGPSGTGKTYSVKTLVDTGLEVFCLFAEPGLESLMGAWVDRKESIPPNLHWHYLQPKTQDFNSLKLMVENIGKFDLKGLANMKDMQRSLNNQMIDLYTVMNDFQDQRTGKNYGSVAGFTNGSVFVLDSFSALVRIAFEMQVGNKPVKDISDWGIVQNVVMSFLHKMTSGCNCHFVLIAHVEREIDQVLGGIKLMVSAPGKAIAGLIPQPFSDVILTSREGDKFYWDTANSQADLKTRNLPIASKLPADFGAIYEKWKSRAEAASQV